jgi:hypothetical protein
MRRPFGQLDPTDERALGRDLGFTGMADCSSPTTTALPRSGAWRRRTADSASHGYLRKDWKNAPNPPTAAAIPNQPPCLTRRARRWPPPLGRRLRLLLVTLSRELDPEYVGKVAA